MSPLCVSDARESILDLRLVRWDSLLKRSNEIWGKVMAEREVGRRLVGEGANAVVLWRMLMHRAMERRDNIVDVAVLVLEVGIVL